ncbi:MAG: RHS repeat protein [Thermoanaerobaculia bacterium]|nr:RHS repeat protein [Thermoanaerobaculia bacterium]
MPFAYETLSVFTPEGRLQTIDPPGYATDDQTAYTYDPARGNLFPATRTDPLIGTTTFGYDAFNRQTSVTDANGVTTETVYDALDRPTFVTQRGATPAEDLVTENRYNVFGDLFQTILPKGNVIEYGYDAAGRLISVERKPTTAANSHGERSVYTLDNYGHRIREDLQRWETNAWATKASTAWQYANRCQLAKLVQGVGSAAESITEHAYDCDGNLERVWDANHDSLGQTVPATTVYGYDDLDRVASVTQPFGGAGGGSAVTAYQYDVQDHLSQVTDAEGGVTTYTTSDRDLLTREESEVSGVTTYSYNEHGELETQTDARGITMTRTIDALDRPTLVDYPDDTLDVTYTYDDPLVPFSKGRLTRIERDGEAVDYRYDRFGRLTQDGQLGYLLDKNGNRQEIAYPGGVIARYTHDYADREATLQALVPGEATRSVVTASSWLPAGRSAR